MKARFTKTNLKGKEVKMMKKMAFVMLVVCLLFGMTSATSAFWVGSVWNDQLNAFVPGIMGFDESSSGSGVAVGFGTPGTAPPVNTYFTFDYQATVVGMTDSLGQPVSFPGLTTSFEYTVIAQFPEQLTNLINLGGGLFIATFVTVPGGVTYTQPDGVTTYDAPLPTFAIWHDPTADADVSAGTGFDNGDALVATGTINPGQISTFTIISPNSLQPPYPTGIGTTILEGLVLTANGTYLDPAPSIFDFRVESNLNQPPLDSTTDGFFDGNQYTRYVFNIDTDAEFKVDASSKFSVPEPSTLLLLGIGLLGVAGIFRKRTKQ